MQPTNEYQADLTIGYARVSSHDQKEDLKRQAIRLEDYCSAHGWSYEIINDLGSGMNYNKRGLTPIHGQKLHLSRKSLIHQLYEKKSHHRLGVFDFFHYAAKSSPHALNAPFDRGSGLTRERDFINIAQYYYNNIQCSVTIVICG